MLSGRVRQIRAFGYGDTLHGVSENRPQIFLDQVAPEPNRLPEEPNPPRERVEDLKVGRLVAELATLVNPVFEPTLRFSAVRKLFGLWDDR
jgi:hypothetical protein